MLCRVSLDSNVTDMATEQFDEDSSASCYPKVVNRSVDR